MQNIHTMEELTRTQTNLALLRKHQADQCRCRRKRTIDVELVGLRVGDFVLVTFPGELTVQIGLNIKKASPHPRHVRRRLHQRLHLLRADGRAAAERRRRPGRQRLPPGAGVAEAVRGARSRRC